MKWQLVSVAAFFFVASTSLAQVIPAAGDAEPIDRESAGEYRLEMERHTMPGIDAEERSQAVVVRRGNKLLLVVWTDGHGAGGHTGRPGNYSWEYFVTMRDANGRAVTWETKFVGDRFSSVEFYKGETCPRTDGRVILLRTQGEKHEVERFDIDLADYSPDTKGLQKLSQQEDVAAFWKR